MKIYTKTGDTGESSLLKGVRKRKNEPIFWLIGTIDELNSCLGLSKNYIKIINNQKVFDLVGNLEFIQKSLFNFNAEIIAIESSITLPIKITEKEINLLESQIDKWEIELPVLTDFILPGETHIEAVLHQARAICRRAERELVSLGLEREFRNELYAYLNRLSDWLFMIARYTAFLEEETKKSA